MISKITLKVDREFLEGYRVYKIDEVLKGDNESEYAYTLLGDFINRSTYNLNRLFEEMEDDVETLELHFEDLKVMRNHKPSALSGLDDLFGDDTSDDDYF